MAKKKKKRRWEFSTVRIIETLNGHIVVLDDEVTVPVTNWFDDEGDLCHRDDAVLCVAGRDDFGWLTIEIHSIYEKVH
jgi:hypothetical protein